MGAETKNIDWKKYFKELNYVGKGNKNTYLISIDTEYTQVTRYSNTCLSYQISALRTEDDEYQEKFIDIENNERKTLAELIEITLDLFTEVAVGERTHIKLIAHNSIAEVSMLADKEQYIKNLQIIRKTLTTKNPININHSGGKYVVDLYDSMLIAPVGFYSLKKLASILGDEGMMKVDISQFEIENMDILKDNNRHKFEEYAMQDSRVTLAVWLFLQTQYNKLVNEVSNNQSKTQYFKTLGTAAVKAFTEHIKYQELNEHERESFKEYLYTFLNPNKEYINFINNTYFGGRNESFFIGYTQDYNELKDKYLYIDLDFSGAYPTGISSIPRVLSNAIEVVNTNEMIHDWYKRAKENEAIAIVGFADIEFIFPTNISFPSIPIKHQQYGLIYPSSGNSLITAVEVIFFIEQLKQHDKNIDIDKHITVKKSIELLPLTDSKNKPDLLLKRYFKGMILKRDKAKKISNDIAGGYTKKEVNLSKLQDKLYKELVNTAYGKFSQSINKKNTYDLAKSITKPLTRSKITSTYIASTTTGIVRAALSALIYAVEKYNQNKKEKIILISATTDGILFGVPKKSIKGESKINYEQPEKIEINELIEDFIKVVEKFYPIQLLKQTRESFGKGYLEVKHIATEVFSIKTRGQIGYSKNPASGKRKVSVLAKFGHKPPLSELYDKETYKAIMEDSEKRNEADAKWLVRKYKQIRQKHKKIKTYKVRSLIGARKIFDPNEPYQDYIGINAEKKINFDYDYKRLLEKNSPYTKPYKNLKQMLKHRYAMENIRKRGLNANTELVEAKVQTNNTNIRIRGSIQDHALKMILRGIFNGTYELAPKLKLKAKEIVIRINDYIKDKKLDIKLINVDTIKNAKRLIFEPNTIPNMPSIEIFIKDIYKLLDIEFNKLYLDVYLAKNDLVAKKLETPSQRQAFKVFLEWLFRAVVKPNSRLPVFGMLKLDSIQEVRSELMDSIKGTEIDIDEETLNEYIEHALKYTGNLKYNHIPNNQGSKAVIQQMRLAILKYIPRNEQAKNRQIRVLTVRDFNNLLLERVERIKVKKNPAKDSCLKYFILGYLNYIEGFESEAKNKNNEIIKKHKNIVIIDRLASFGLNKAKFYKIRKDKFIYKGLKDTPENRSQVRKMCQRLDIKSSNKVFEALL